MTSIIDYAEYWWFSFSAYPLVVKIAICVIFFSSFVTMLLLARIFFVRRNKRRKRNIITRLRPQLFSFLRNIILSRDTYTSKDVHTLYVQQFGRLEKKAYMSLIPALEDVVYQEKNVLDSDNYNSIVLGLKINKCLEERLDSSNKRLQLLALQSLSRLGLTVADSKILPYAYSNDHVLRKESRASYMGVSNNNPFKFFDEEDTFNEWEEINLMQQFQMHHKDHLPDFSKWIRYSEDDEKIKFFIRQAAFFNQQTSLSTIAAILQHDDYRVRKEAIIAIGKMKADDQESKLANMYFSQPLVCQFAIIEAISFLNTGRSLEFLEKAYNLASNPDLKRLAAEAIYFYGERGRSLFEELLETADSSDKKILEHVQNKLITSTLKSFHGFSKSYDQNIVPVLNTDTPHT